MGVERLFNILVWDSGAIFRFVAARRASCALDAAEDYLTSGRAPAGAWFLVQDALDPMKAWLFQAYLPPNPKPVLRLFEETRPR